jgi:hypothetical protein
MAAKKFKKTPADIQTIIDHLAHRKRQRRLCRVGRERLRWWRKHRYEFPNAKAAVRSWDTQAISAWLDDQDRVIPYTITHRFHWEPEVLIHNRPQVMSPQAQQLETQLRSQLQADFEALHAANTRLKDWMRRKPVRFFGVNKVCN